MTTIRHRRGTAAQWTSANPTLASGELGFETDTGKHKIGDGSTAWAGLEYFLPTSDLSATYAPIVASPGAGVDCGALLQAALDTHRVIQLKPGDSYLLSTAVFLDGTNITDKYAIYANGATITLGNALPTPSTWDTGIGAAPPTAFFNGTLRAGLSGGVVTTTAANGATSAPQGVRLTIHDARLVSGSTPGLVAFGGRASNGTNGTATGLVNCTLSGFRAGISWSGYADGNFAEGVEVASNPAGSSTRIIYQRDSGDSTRAIRCKAYGGYIADLAGSTGFTIENPISGQITVAACHGDIRTGHQETDENASAAPWSLNIDRSHVTLHDHYTRSANNATHYSVRINDAVVTATLVASEVLIKGWRAAANYLATQGDAAKGPDLHIVALGPSGRVRVENSRGVVIRAGTSATPQGLYVTAADSDIQTALTAGADYLATGNWLLSYSGSWRVGPVADAEPQPRRLQAPGLAVANDAFITTGALVNTTTYEYVAAVKTAAGGYSALSSAVQVVANANGTANLTVTNTTGPITVALWRKAAAGVAAAPDRYIELGLDAHTALWVDTGVNLNGRPWQTTSLPVPDTVKSTGCQYVFPRVVRKTANEVVNANATLQNDNELVFPVAANGVYRFRCALFYDSSQAGDIKVGFDVPAGATLAFGQLGASTGATGNSGSVSFAAGTTDATQAANLGGAAVGTKIMATFEGTVAVAGTGGVIQVMWSQATSDATDTTVYAGSFLDVVAA